MKRWLALAYGAACYLLVAAVAVYAICFLNDWWFSRSINRGADVALLPAVLVDLTLIVLFGLQHSVMARSGFKRWWMRIVPPPIERSTYVLCSNVALAFLFWCWQPIPDVLWHVTNPVARLGLAALAGTGCVMMIAANVQIDHFELFGLRQVWAYWRGRPEVAVPFRTPGLYRWVRHPLMLGLLLALWATPQLTWGRLLFNTGMTIYVLLGLRWEERDLIRRFGHAYADYRRRVPMLLPWKWGKV